MREVEYLFRHINTVELEGLSGAWLLAHTQLFCFILIIALSCDKHSSAFSTQKTRQSTCFIGPNAP